MAMVIRVRFRRATKLYDFDPNGLDLHNGTQVVTETARGMELGECMSGIMDVPDERLVLPLKPVIRIATEQDLALQRRNEQSEKEAFGIAVERIAEHKLEMKLVDVEYAFDHSKIIFYFTANGRVDFRMLVKNLASIFKTRIELRQIGVRDEAKMLGGIGPCGRPICCRTFLSDFTPVSIKMAKEQNLSLNPTKISGLCDRLMCCLKYEQDHYETTRKRMPRVGREIMTPDGLGVINAINVLRETVRVRVAVGDAFELREYRIDDCQRSGQDAPQTAQNPQTPDETQRDVVQPMQDAQAEQQMQDVQGEQPAQNVQPAQSEQPAPQVRQTGSARQSGAGSRTDREPRPRADRPRNAVRTGDRPDRPERGQRPPRRPENPVNMPREPRAPFAAQQPGTQAVRQASPARQSDKPAFVDAPRRQEPPKPTICKEEIVQTQTFAVETAEAVQVTKTVETVDVIETEKPMQPENEAVDMLPETDVIQIVEESKLEDLL